MAENLQEFEEIIPDADTTVQVVTPEPEFEEITPDVDGMGEELPSYANGMSPTAPINKSPIDPVERAKLSFGNDQGKEEFLKSKFQAVQKDQDGNFVVQKDGLWHRVDAKNLEDVDPWKLTKGLAKFGAAVLNPIGTLVDPAARKDLLEDEVSGEIIGDYADVAKEGLAINASIVSGGAAGGLGILGQSAAAGATGAAAASINTSLGRAVGTYEAPVEQQVKDIAFESILNTLGVAIPMGVKPTGQWLSKQIPILAKAYNSMDDVGKAIINKTWGKLSAGEKAFEAVQTYPAELSAAMKRYSKTAGDETFEQLAQTNSIAQIEQLSRIAPQIESKMYNKMSADIVRAAPDDFVAPLRETVTDVYREATKSGLGVLQVGGKKLSQQETFAALAKGALPADARFVIRSQKEILDELQSSGAFNDFADLATDAQAYRQVMGAFRQIDQLAKAKPLTGKAGAKQLLDFQKITNRITYNLKQQGSLEGNTTTQGFARSLNDTLKNRFTKSFDAFTPKDSSGRSLYTALNEEYSAAKKALDTLTNATKNKNNTKSAEGFKNRLFAPGAKNTTEKNAMKQLAETAKRHGLPEAQLIQQAQKALMINEAAIAFNPLIKPGLLGQGSATMAAGTGLGYLAGGAAGFLPGLLGGAAVTSPKLAYGLMQGKNFLSGLTKQQLEALRANPEVLAGLVQTTVQTGEIQDQVTQQLLGGQGQPK